MLLFALSDKKQKPEMVMMAKYAEDVWVPSVRNEKCVRACYLMSEEGGELFLGLFHTCWVVYCAQRRKKLEDVLTVSSPDSLMHAQKKKKTSSLFPPEKFLGARNQSLCSTFTHLSCLGAKTVKIVVVLPIYSISKNNVWSQNCLFINTYWIRITCTWQITNLDSKCSI